MLLLPAGLGADADHASIAPARRRRYGRHSREGQTTAASPRETAAKISALL